MPTTDSLPSLGAPERTASASRANDIDAEKVYINNIINNYGQEETAAAFSHGMSESLKEELKTEIESSSLNPEEKKEIMTLIDKSFAQGTQPDNPELQEAISDNYGETFDATAEDIMSDMSMDALNTTNNRGKGKSWLEALAGSLANIQDKFLGKAMDNLAKMEGNAEGATGSGGDSQARSDFLQAQSLFQANMQLFNTTMTMSANILKTVGEALNTMGRKGQ